MKHSDTPEFDVSVVLNLHREAVYVFRTLRSLCEAASYASHCGLSVELVIVFDRSDDATRQAAGLAEKFGFARVSCIDVEHGSLGPSRNSGIAETNGRYVWLADADDLVSFNCIERMYLIAQTEERVAVFPEYLIAFGTACWIAKYFGDLVIETADFVYGHPFISRLFIRRDVFNTLQFADLRLSKGFAYEDWLLNCELRARGYRFLIAPKTLFFYRQREGSLLRQANMISVGQIPHSTLFEPGHFTRVVEKERIARNNVEFLRRRAEARNCLPQDEVLKDTTCMELLAAAVKVDPGIDISVIERGGIWCNVWPDPHWGESFFDVCKLIGSSKFTDVVLLPWLSAGGGERFILDVLTALQDSDPTANFLVISGESHAKHTWLHKLPAQSVFLDLYNSFPRLTEEERDQLTLRTILACVGDRNVRLHLKTSPFAHRIFSKFSDCLDGLRAVYYRFCDSRYTRGRDVFELGYGFDFISNHLTQLALIVTDHERIAIEDRRRCGIERHKWHHLYANHATRSLHRDVKPKKRLLWASRLNPQKRLEVLRGIAIKASHLVPGISIDAFGAADSDVSIEKLFHESNSLTYKGGYLDFDELQPDKYDALIYTAHFDGLPNVVLEAMSWGLPVIAPDVGGLSEAVQDGMTGYLLPDLTDDEAMCSAYARAIQKLYQDWDATLAMGHAAQDLIRRRHSPDAYRRRIAEIFFEERMA